MPRPPSPLGAASVRARWDHVREPVLDVTGAVLLWAVPAIDLATRPPDAGQSPSTPAAYLWAGVIAAPFAAHRRFPVPAMVVSSLALIGYSLGRYSAFPGYATFALVFAVALHTGGRRALAVYLGGMVALVASLWLQPAEVATASSWISTVLTVTVAWLAGENLRARRERRRQELDQAHRLAEQRAQDARRALGAERLRIARDLHDVVAHSLSVIVVQAGVAHHVVDDRPEVARTALGNIEVTAREGMVEMRRLLGVLRSESDPAGRDATTPAEGMRDVDRLVTQIRAAGVRLEVTGLDDVGDLPPALDISAYRIIQEGLTNVLRHGGPVAQLAVRQSPSELRVEIRNDGAGSPAGPAPVGSGHGLIGIRERAALFAGQVQAEPQRGGGFRLVVELPIGPPTVVR